MSKGTPETFLEAIEHLNVALAELWSAILNEVARGLDWLFHMQELRRRSFPDE